MRITTRRIFQNLRGVFSSEGRSDISQLRSGWFLAQRFFQVPKGRRTFSAVPSGRNFLRTVFQPLRSWLISGCRSATQFAAAAIIFLFTVGATAQTTNDLSDAEIQGRNLARQLLEQKPTENFTNTGVLKIRDAKGRSSEIPLEFEVVVTPTNWINNYNASEFVGSVTSTNSGYTSSWTREFFLQIIHPQNRPNEYKYENYLTKDLDEAFGQFPNSDFSFADLGLEFFHWPEQMILKKENRRSRACNVLESTNPNPSTNGYSRVVSWIDEESGGIVHAEAYDAQNKLLKEFDPKSFKKVNGQWLPELMEMENVQTGSRSWIDFNPAGTPPPKQQGEK
jgi:hypothetical protein